MKNSWNFYNEQNSHRKTSSSTTIDSDFHSQLFKILKWNSRIRFNYTNTPVDLYGSRNMCGFLSKNLFLWNNLTKPEKQNNFWNFKSKHSSKSPIKVSPGVDLRNAFVCLQTRILKTFKHLRWSFLRT